MTKKTLRARNQTKFRALKNKGQVQKKSKPFAPELKRIENHAFYQNLLKYAIIPLWEFDREEKKAGKELEPTEGLRYHAHVSQFAISLFEALKRLHDIPYFMEQNPSLRQMENRNVSPQEWFVYHHANYRVVATGVLDTALLVVNDVLKMGIDPGKLKRKDFLERRELSDSGILPSLRKLDELIDKYRQERNKYVHRSERPDVEFVDNLNIYRFLKEAKEKGLYKGQLPKQALAHAYFNQQRGSKAAEMRKDTVEIFKVIHEFLDALNPIYFEKLSKM